MNSAKLSGKSYRFRIKLERGRRGCKAGDPSGRVSKVELRLDGRVVAELEAQPGNCWQRRDVYLPAGKNPSGAKLLVLGRGGKGGLVRAWLDAIPLKGANAAAGAPVTKPASALKPGRTHYIVPRTKVVIGAMGTVKFTLGPFSIPGLDWTRFEYVVEVSIPSSYGKACDASKELRPHKVRSINVKLNGKPAMRSEPVNECGFTFSTETKFKLPAAGNRLLVEATGRPGAWFRVGYKRRLK